jgi:hypothetical protein
MEGIARRRASVMLQQGATDAPRLAPHACICTHASTRLPCRRDGAAWPCNWSTRVGDGNAKRLRDRPTRKRPATNTCARRRHRTPHERLTQRFPAAARPPLATCAPKNTHARVQEISAVPPSSRGRRAVRVLCSARPHRRASTRRRCSPRRRAAQHRSMPAHRIPARRGGTGAWSLAR